MSVDYLVFDRGLQLLARSFLEQKTVSLHLQLAS
jgi:hypothetical protein